jgi:hypothetical protein
VSLIREEAVKEEVVEDTVEAEDVEEAEEEEDEETQIIRVPIIQRRPMTPDQSREAIPEKSGRVYPNNRKIKSTESVSDLKRHVR